MSLLAHLWFLTAGSSISATKVRHIKRKSAKVLKSLLINTTVRFALLPMLVATTETALACVPVYTKRLRRQWWWGPLAAWQECGGEFSAKEAVKIFVKSVISATFGGSGEILQAATPATAVTLSTGHRRPMWRHGDSSEAARVTVSGG